jgi:hypothetical protein
MKVCRYVGMSVHLRVGMNICMSVDMNVRLDVPTHICIQTGRVPSPVLCVDGTSPASHYQRSCCINSGNGHLPPSLPPYPTHFHAALPSTSYASASHIESLHISEARVPRRRRNGSTMARPHCTMPMSLLTTLTATCTIQGPPVTIDCCCCCRHHATAAAGIPRIPRVPRSLATGPTARCTWSIGE